MKSNPPKKESTEKQRIEIIMKKCDPRYVEGLLLDFFRRDVSPVMPIYVKFNVGAKKIDRDLVETSFFDFKIVEVNQDPNIYSDELAKIVVQEYPNYMSIFINKESKDEHAWKKMIKVTEAIISKMQDLEFGIISIYPSELQPANIYRKSEISNPPDNHIDKTKEIELPSSPLRLKRWQKVWELINNRVQSEKIKSISEWLEKTKPDLPSSEATLNKIITAGLNGYLSEKQNGE